MPQVTEIYASIQGEGLYSGWPCSFIRLTGCPLRCRWCDTAYGFLGGEKLTISEILERVKINKIPMVELTGGEPLAQVESFELIEALVAKNYKVLLETSGSEPVKDVHPDCHIIMDLKCPGSGMVEKNNYENLKHLKASDEIKFVVASREDFDWVSQIIAKLDLFSVCSLSVSPAFALVKPEDLAAWILQSPWKSLRLNLQIHKYIWHPRAKGV